MLGFVGFIGICLVVVGFIAHRDHEKYGDIAYDDPDWLEGKDPS